MRPLSIPSAVKYLWNGLDSRDFPFLEIKQRYHGLLKEKTAPDVSIVIPAYNEEATIVQTILSLCLNKTQYSAEIIIVNNNSTDRTEEFAVKCGVTCIQQTIQGITPTRNMGLGNAKGRFILNADADTIYPEAWIEEMVKPLERDEVALTYGRFSFIPIGSTGRFTYFFYEYLADWTRYLNRFIKDEAVNVYGFNSGFKREQGLQVDGFNHPEGTNEDGYLAFKLRENGFGRLFYVTSPKALVWTTDRRIQIDGGLWRGTVKRLERVLSRR